MTFRLISLASAAALALLTSCGDSAFGPTRSSVIAAQDSAALFRTDSQAYALATTALGTEGRIRATFTNRSGRTMHFVNCGGATMLSMQELVGDRWTEFWSPAIDLCLSPPITVPNGGTHTFDIRVFSGKPGGNASPRFERPLRAALYRVIWHDAYFSYQDRLPWGESVPEPQRVSNSFTLSAP